MVDSVTWLGHGSRKISWGAEKMAQWLRLFAACPEDWSSGVSQSSNTQRKENEWSLVCKNEQGLGQLRLYNREDQLSSAGQRAQPHVPPASPQQAGSPQSSAKPSPLPPRRQRGKRETEADAGCPRETVLILLTRGSSVHPATSRSLLCPTPAPV